MTERVECVVIGAGVVGLAIARALARRGHETLVLESERQIGSGTSARNSGVIHAGIHYPPGSLKARLCVAGRTALYRYCAERGIEHRRCGKLIVATAAGQIPALERIVARARECGVEELELLTRAQARELEPALECVAAIHSPLTGIVDPHDLMQALQADVEQHGGSIVLGAPVLRGGRRHSGLWLEVGGAERVELQARSVVNCAGLAAQAVARSLGVPEAVIPPLRYAKGNYFALRGRSPFARLIYPIPEGGGLGVHLTLDLAGRARFGPDVEWVESIDYAVDPRRVASFCASIRTYWPGLPDAALQPAYAGIRPKLHGPDEPAGDFVIQDAAVHGVPGLVNLYGIESPGLTASLAIGEHVAEKGSDLFSRK